MFIRGKYMYHLYTVIIIYVVGRFVGTPEIILILMVTTIYKP
jgi:hypothetical protein